MNTLRLIAAITLLSAAVSPAAPGDLIEPKDFPDKVSLTLGTKGTIQLTQEGDKVTAATLVKESDEKQPGIRVDFKMQAEFLGLTIKNGLPKALRYRAAIRMKGRKEYHETSLIVPVMPGLVGFETWQDPIEELILFDFKLTDEKLER